MGSMNVFDFTSQERDLENKEKRTKKAKEKRREEKREEKKKRRKESCTLQVDEQKASPSSTEVFHYEHFQQKSCDYEHFEKIVRF